MKRKYSDNQLQKEGADKKLASNELPFFHILGRPCIEHLGREITLTPYQPTALLLVVALKENPVSRQELGKMLSTADGVDFRINVVIKNLEKTLGQDILSLAFKQDDNGKYYWAGQTNLPKFYEHIDKEQFRMALDVYQGGFAQGHPLTNKKCRGALGFLSKQAENLEIKAEKVVDKIIDSLSNNYSLIIIELNKIMLNGFITINLTETKMRVEAELGKYQDVVTSYKSCRQHYLKNEKMWTPTEGMLELLKNAEEKCSGIETASINISH